MRPIIETINSIIGGQSGSPQYQELIKKAYQDPEVQSFLRKHRAELSDEQIKRGGSDLHCPRLYPPAGRQRRPNRRRLCTDRSA